DGRDGWVCGARGRWRAMGSGGGGPRLFLVFQLVAVRGLPGRPHCRRRLSSRPWHADPAPSETGKTVTVPVSGDKKEETDKMFCFDLFDNSGSSPFVRRRDLGLIS